MIHQSLSWLPADVVLHLRRLATAALREPLPRDYTFRMEKYTDTLKSTVCAAVAAAPCGTVGCLAGLGPYAGVEAAAGENWDHYAYRLCGELPDRHTARAAVLWRTFFSSGWSACDNTPEGGGRRILYVLTYGLPGGDGQRPRQDLLKIYQNWEPPAELYLTLAEYEDQLRLLVEQQT